MRTIGKISVYSTMKMQGVLDPRFLTCPVCRAALKKNAAHVRGHLLHHVKEGKIPRGLTAYIAMLVANKRGCNRRIDVLDDETKTQVKAFYQEMTQANYNIADCERKNTVKIH